MISQGPWKAVGARFPGGAAAFQKESHHLRFVPFFLLTWERRRKRWSGVNWQVGRFGLNPFWRLQWVTLF